MTEVIVICVDDTRIPKEIPKEKRVKAGTSYHVVKIVVCQPQNRLGYWLEEIDLDETCKPFEYWLSDRFVLLGECQQAFIEMVQSHDALDALKENGVVITTPKEQLA